MHFRRQFSLCWRVRLSFCLKGSLRHRRFFETKWKSHCCTKSNWERVVFHSNIFLDSCSLIDKKYVVSCDFANNGSLTYEYSLQNRCEARLYLVMELHKTGRLDYNSSFLHLKKGRRITVLTFLEVQHIILVKLFLL